MLFARMLSLMILVMTGAVSASNVNVAVPYNKNPIAATEGLLYLQAKLKKSPSFKAKLAKSRSLRVDLYHEAKRQFYSFSQKFISNRTSLTEVFVLPVGEYRLVRVTVEDDRQVPRAWFLETSDYPVVRIRPATVSNLGSWIVSEQGPDRLEIEFRATDNKFVLSSSADPTDIKTAIDGLSGVVQETSAPITLSDQDAYDPRGEVLADFSYSQDVYLTYEINLFREAQFANLLKIGIDRQVPKLGACYSNASGTGSILVSFVASPATKSLQNVRIQRSDFRDQNLQKCVRDRLAEMPLTTPKSFLGVVTLRAQVGNASYSTH